MVALNHFTGDIQALDAVGIDRSLRQPFGVGDLLCLGIEYLHKIAADDFSLLLRLFDAGEVGEEFLAGIHADYFQPKAFVIAHDVVKLILTQHAVIDEDTGQPVPYCAMQQNSYYR